MAPLEDMSETGALGLELADRGTRLGACFCDAFIWGSLGFIASNFVNTRLGPFFAMHFKPVALAQWILNLVLMATWVMVFFLINGWSLAARGQTVGKRICKIRLAKSDGTVPGLRETFVRRFLVFTIPGLIPDPLGVLLSNVVNVIDILFIFRHSRKCLHDDIAGTIVVKV